MVLQYMNQAYMGYDANITHGDAETEQHVRKPVCAWRGSHPFDLRSYGNIVPRRRSFCCVKESNILPRDEEKGVT